MSSSDPEPLHDFRGRIAVVTGGGSGIGRELAIQLSAAGADVALCDIDRDGLAGTVELASATAPAGVRFMFGSADVSVRDQLDSFAADVAEQFDTEAVHLLFNNAGTSGAGSIVHSDEAQWDRVFSVTWGGVLNGTRAFLPMLLAADRSQVVNVASINSMWACLGAEGPHSAYCSAKFAVRGFTEALIADFRLNAPHVTAAVVMPGHVGTPIARNALAAAAPSGDGVSAAYLAHTRTVYAARGIDLSDFSDDRVRQLIDERLRRFETTAPTSPVQAATAILDGVRAGRWRIVIGPDAEAIDRAVRADPEAAYEQSFTDALTDQGHFLALIGPR